jgi:hypothetical protein
MAGDWYGVDTVIFAPDFQFFIPRILYLVTAKFWRRLDADDPQNYTVRDGILEGTFSTFPKPMYSTGTINPPKKHYSEPLKL